MQIEVGKRYIMRNGKVSGKICSVYDRLYPFYDVLHNVKLTPEGCRFVGVEQSEYDLVKEYIEPVSPSEVSGKESTVEYDLSGIPTGYEFVGVRSPKCNEEFVGRNGAVAIAVKDFKGGDVFPIVKPITPPEPKQRTVVIHKWLVWDLLGKERMVFGTEKYIGDCGFSDAVDLGLYEEVKVNV